MLDTFLKAAYENEARRDMERSATELLKQLPESDLVKMASGEKLAEADPSSFLEKFRGTPLFDDALALEEEALQMEMADAQRQQERRAESQMQDAMWNARDTVRIKKRLLELELAKGEAGTNAMTSTPAPNGVQPAPAPAPMLPAAPAPGSAGEHLGKVASRDADKKTSTKDQKPRLDQILDSPTARAIGGTLATTAAEYVNQMMWNKMDPTGFGRLFGGGSTVAGAVAKMEAKNTKANEKKRGQKRSPKEASIVLQMGDSLGRELARADAKHAASLANAVKTVARNPITALSAGGAVGGLAAGLRKDEEGKRHPGRGVGGALAGAAGGAAAGLAVRHLEKLRGRSGVKALPQGESSGARHLHGGAAAKALPPASEKHSAAREAIGRAMKAVGRHPVGALAAAGGAAGGLAGGLRKDEEGKRHVGHAAGGALAGAAGGASAGLAVRSLKELRRLRAKRLPQGDSGTSKHLPGGADSAPKALPSAGEKHASSAARIGRAVKAVARHPTAALASVGGAGGFAHGMRKDEEGKRHLGRGVGEGLAGAAGGAALGHGVHKLRRGGGSVTKELPASPQHKALAESSAKHAAPLLTAGAGAARAGVGSAIKGIAQAASRFARKPEHAPTLVGAGLGGLSGLARGIHEKDEHGQRHLGRGLSQGLTGALAGGMVGSVSGHLGRSMASGKSFGDAAKSYADNWGRARALP